MLGRNFIYPYIHSFFLIRCSVEGGTFIDIITSVYVILLINAVTFDKCVELKSYSILKKITFKVDYYTIMYVL